MSTSTDSTSPSQRSSDLRSDLASRIPQNRRTGALVATVSSVLLLVSGLLSWCYDDRVLGNIAPRFNPAGIQVYVMIIGAIGLFLGLVGLGVLKSLSPWINLHSGLRALGWVSVIFVGAAMLAIVATTGGLINANEGAWVALVGALGVLGASFMVPQARVKDLSTKHLPAVAEIVIIAVIFGLGLFVVAHLLGTSDSWALAALLITLIGVSVALAKAGVLSFFSGITARHRRVFTLAAFVVAVLFPFTQGGSATNMSIAGNVLIFAAAALGLNIVVGLAGLLDLGYIAFLGAGAYVGATMSYSAFATIDWKPPFLVVMIIGGIVSSILGLIIGSPTLRVSGDYLAIVTLAFGEIFRLAMFNFDGQDGPDITHGSNGINAIPDLNLFGFDFGQTHNILGVDIPRAGNYYFVLLALIAFIILVFTHLNNSRIGRGWVAIREDERAAEAMGVNVFGLKLLAFSGGAFLAGMAGTIKAHQDVAVSPDSYIFLESAFLLAAVVLGGMGTVGGVLLGAALLKFIPEKLRDLEDYRLLLFGLLLIIMMRFRPEGLVASRRRQLEFHDDDEELAVAVQEEHLDIKEARA